MNNADFLGMIYCITIKKGLYYMSDNQTGILCEVCSSHFYKYIENSVLIIECSNCGSNFQTYDYPLEVGDLYDEEKDL
ncbi:hypothetical protein [Staphylococcus equorum]|uniref:Uncharacterized protein n=1 Tax=Staphylococcus equorum TaxID=246432 RepID=A0A9X4LBY8_9STAP|nr:hypothetical protein [Staphylococcus equorum]MDG0860313.1 hypothetical protein [Staphylococcus equorum]